MRETKILSASTTKKLEVEQGSKKRVKEEGLKREQRVRSCKFQRNCKL